MRDPLLFGDYRTALTPEQPRVYEDIQDYDAAKGLFEEVSMYAPNCSEIVTFIFHSLLVSLLRLSPICCYSVT